MKIQIVLHALPREIDDVHRIVDQLKRSNYFLSKGQEILLDFTLNVSDHMVDWKKSKLPKEFFIKKFKYIESLSTFHNDFKITTEISGCNSVRRNAIRSNSDTTHILFLDCDLYFSQFNLQMMFQAIKSIQDKYYIISSELIQGWDPSWDVISNPKTRNTPRIYHEDGITTNRSKSLWGTTDPYDMYMENNIDKIPSLREIKEIKFGGGWFNLFNKELLKLIDIPDSLGVYGLDDTYIAYGCMIMKKLGYNVNQYVLENMNILEDHFYRKNVYDDLLVLKDVREHFKQIATKAWPNEINLLQNKLREHYKNEL